MNAIASPQGCYLGKRNPTSGLVQVVLRRAIATGCVALRSFGALSCQSSWGQSLVVSMLGLGGGR